MINDLYKTEISQSQEEEEYIKKLISNVNSGLLENHTIKNKTVLFMILLERLYFIKVNMVVILM